jgi:glycine cleavage system transcriptional repressor
MPSNHYAISIMAQDRVGIVHEVASAISTLDGNIDNISQSVLNGYFAMILITSFPDAVTPEAIDAALHAAGDKLGLQPVIGIKAMTAPPAVPPAPVPDVYVLSASGPDRIGFVATMTGFCAENNINIIDLDTRTAGDTYIMLLVVQLTSVDPRAAQAKLTTFGQQSGLKVTLQHYDVFQATHEVEMPS